MNAYQKAISGHNKNTKKAVSHDQSVFLHTQNTRYRQEVKKYILGAYEGDLGKRGDCTTRFFLKNKNATARVFGKEDGILAGMEEIEWFIQYIGEKKGEKLHFSGLKDGSEINKNILRQTKFSNCKNYIFQHVPRQNLPNKFLVEKKSQKFIHQVQKSTNILTITGNLYTLFEIERTILNVLQHMSGIATQTRKLVEKIEKNKNLENHEMEKNALKTMNENKTAIFLAKPFLAKPIICATRKTLWGLLDKKAVSVGGGGTHRLGLDDAILLKKNHLKLLNYDFEKIMHAAEKQCANEKNKNIGKNILKRKTHANISVTGKNTYCPRFFEVEIENENEAIACVKSLLKINSATATPKKWSIPIILMFDNMKPDSIKQTMEKIRQIRQSFTKTNQMSGSKNFPKFEDLLFEASGGIHGENIVEYAKTGVDILSLGSLTHSARSLDMHMVIEY